MKECISVNNTEFFGKNDSETIQNAIAAACEDGCRKIVIPRYNARTDKTEWRIPVCILVPDDFTILLDNCYMVQETGVFQNMFANSRAFDDDKHDIKYEQKNIAVIGIGNVVLDGGKHNRSREKITGKYGLPTNWLNPIFYWYNVNGLRVENINIQHQRYWAMLHVYSRNAVIKNIHFYAIPHVNTMDGIDIRVGNNNFYLENITGRTGDDIVALNTINQPPEQQRKIEGKSPDIHHVKLRNIKGDPDFCMCVRILNHDGHKIHDVDIDTIMDTSDYVLKSRPMCALAFGSPIYYWYYPMRVGDLYNFNVKNITTRAGAAIYFNYALEHVKISNIHVFGNGVSCFAHGQPGRFGGCHFDDVNFEHIFYAPVQYDMYGCKTLPKEDYRGIVFDFIQSTGEINLKDVNIDKVNIVFKVNGGVKVKAEDYKLCEAAREFVVDEDSTVTIDGKAV